MIISKYNFIKHSINFLFQIKFLLELDYKDCKLSSNILFPESNVNIHIDKAWTAIDR